MGETRFFYGWVIVGVTFVTQFVFTGFFFYAFAITLKALAAEFGGGRLGVSAIHGVMPFVGALIAPFIGRAVAQQKSRQLLTAGAIATASGLVLISQATQLWHLYLIFPTLLAFGANTMTGVVASAIVVNWFDRFRARALGLSQVGASAGGMIMAPAGMALVEDAGWRGMYLTYGVVILCLVPLVWLLAIGRPEDRGLHPDGRSPRSQSAPSGSSRVGASMAVARALRQRNLWLIAFVTGIGFMLSSSVVAHGAALGTDAGLELMRASWLLSLFSGAALLGKPLFGWIADRFGERPGFLLSLALQMGGLGGLIAAAGPISLFLAMALLGLGIGGVLPLSAALVARAFGREGFGPMMGLLMPILTPLVAAGIPFAGWVYDRTGSYDSAFWVFLGGLALSVLALWAMRLPERALEVRP